MGAARKLSPLWPQEVGEVCSSFGGRETVPGLTLSWLELLWKVSYLESGRTSSSREDSEEVGEGGRGNYSLDSMLSVQCAET